MTPPAGAPLPTWRADLALVVAAFFFGTTFLIVQDAIERVEVVPFLAVRFLIAAAVLWPLARRRPPTPGERVHAVLAGAMLLAGYVLQTVGLRYTTTTASAFITYLLVVLVPLIGFVVLRRRPHPATLAGVALAVVGLVLLTGGGAGFGRGEVLTLGCAVGFAAHIVVLGETASRHDPIRFTALQLTVVGVACLVPGLFLGGYAFPLSAWAAALGTGVFATALAFWLMVGAQRVVPPSRAALLLLLEPVFAGVLGQLAGERLGARGLSGTVVILVALAVSEVGPRRSRWGSRRSLGLP